VGLPYIHELYYHDQYLVIVRASGQNRIDKTLVPSLFVCEPQSQNPALQPAKFITTVADTEKWFTLPVTPLEWRSYVGRIDTFVSFATRHIWNAGIVRLVTEEGERFWATAMDSVDDVWQLIPFWLDLASCRFASHPHHPLSRYPRKRTSLDVRDVYISRYKKAVTAYTITDIAVNAIILDQTHLAVVQGSRISVFRDEKDYRYERQFFVERPSDEQVIDMVLSPNGRTLAISVVARNSSRDSCMVHLYDLRTNLHQTTFNIPCASHLVFSPDGLTLVVDATMRPGCNDLKSGLYVIDM
jgi:hypothetical protein